MGTHFLSYRVQILHASSYGQSEQNTKVQKYKKYKKSTKSTKVLITQPFFELQTPDFTRKFIWTVEPNDKIQKDKMTKRQKDKEEGGATVETKGSTKRQKYK